MIRQINQLLIVVFGAVSMAILLSRCANPVMPLGGERDITPPQVVRSSPSNYSTNFKGRTISIEFDEFVKLEKISQQALISPSPLTNPEYRIRGKSVQVRFQEDLFENTTYTLFFGNAIVDLTESNPIEGYTFVFSTGSVLDSMSVAGQLHDAFSGKPAEGAYAFLYLTDNDTISQDSLIFKKKPYYIARADKQGNFRFRNLRNEPYYLFGLGDKNSNLLYDKGGEAVAFFDSIVSPEYREPMKTDSLLPVESNEKPDRAAEFLAKRRADSVYFIGFKQHKLRLFTEVDSTQRLMRAEAVSKSQLRFAFRYPAKNVSVEPMDSLPENFKLIRHYSPKADTLFWYFREDILDSLRIHVSLDTLINDTLHLALSPRQSAMAQRRPVRAAVKEGVLQYQSNVQGRRIEIDEPLRFIFSEPVIQTLWRDTTVFVSGKDTIYNAVRFFPIDSAGISFQLDMPPFKPDANYALLIPDSVFISLNNRVNDSIELSWKVPGPAEYGNILIDLNFTNQYPQLIVQLMNQRDDVLREILITKAGRIAFNNLRPAKYKLRAVIDSNQNGRWDTGNITQRLQPERIILYNKELDVRSNWDIEESWEIDKEL